MKNTVIVTGMFGVVCCLPSIGLAYDLPSTAGSTVPAEREASRLFEFDKESQRKQGLVDSAVLVQQDSTGDKISPEAEKYRFFLEKINLQGATLLSEAQINALKTEFEGRNVSLAEVYRLVSLLNKMYADAGYFTCLAIIPRQKIENGRVLVRVIEGKVGNVTVSGNQYTKADFIEDSLKFKSGDVPKLKETNDTFRLFNVLRDPQLEPKFSPGKKIGSTDVNINVKEDKRFSGQLSVDNHGTSQNGEESIGVVLRQAALNGHSDPLTVGWSQGSATESGFINYRHPVGDRGVVSGFSSVSRSRVTQYPAASLGVHSKSRMNTVSYNHVIKAWDPDFIQVKTGFDSLDTESYVGIVRTDAVSQRVWAGVDYARVSENQEFFTTGVLTAAQTNTKSFAGDVSDNVVRLNAAASYKLKSKNGLYGLYQVKGQMTPDKRPPTSEQWSIGGVGSIEAIDTSVVAGDHGLDSRLSLGWAKKNPVKGVSSTDVNVFYNEAVVKSDQNLGLGQTNFKSWGGEVKLALGKDIDAAISVSKGINLPVQLDDGTKALGRVSFNF
jgi:hemolysin activation/secretion protein